MCSCSIFSGNKKSALNFLENVNLLKNQRKEIALLFFLCSVAYISLCGSEDLMHFTKTLFSNSYE